MKFKKTSIAIILIITFLIVVYTSTTSDKNVDKTNDEKFNKNTSEVVTETETLTESNTAVDNHRELLVRTDDNDRIFERDNSTGKYYVNGNEIGFNYIFENHVSNSDGSINTYMNLTPGDNFIIHDDWFGFVDFTTDFFGSQSENKVLVVTLDLVDSAKIDRYASGAYNDSVHDTVYEARVIIDPLTGDVIDMLAPNYYYDYGNQSHSTKDNYTNLRD